MVTIYQAATKLLRVAAVQDGESRSVAVKEDAGDSQPIARQVLQMRQQEAHTLHQASLLKHHLKNVQPARGLQMDRSCEDHQQVSIRQQHKLRLHHGNQER